MYIENVAMEIQQWVPFALLSNCKILRTAVNIVDGLMSACEMPDIFCAILTKFGFSPHIFTS
jgi:hypothetical protein